MHGRACKGAGPCGEGGGRKLAPREEGILKNPSQPRGLHRVRANIERRDKIRSDKIFTDIEYYARFFIPLQAFKKRAVCFDAEREQLTTKN